MNEKIERDFIHHEPTPLSIMKITNILDRARGLARYIDETVPDSREKSLAITNLQQAMTWVKDAIILGQEEEAEALEPKVWATENQTVKCSECDFEISESSKSRYFTCDGGEWIPVFKMKHPEVSARWAIAKNTVMCSECSFEINADRIADYRPCLGGCWVPVTT